MDTGLRLTYDDLRDLPDDGKRYELIGGELIVSPSPKPRHQRAVGHLYTLLRRAEEAGFGVAYLAPLDVVFDPHNVCEPDLLFISRERLSILTEDNVQGAPDVAVEVLSEWSRRRDLKLKLAVYARFGVRVYWVADPEEDVVRVFERRGQALVEVRPPLQAADRLGCELFPGIDADVATLFG